MSRQFSPEEQQAWRDASSKKIVGAKAVIRNNTGGVLLVKPGYKDTWQFPGGVADEKEDPKLTVARELSEELGLIVTAQELVVVDAVYISRDDSVVLLFNYSERVPSETAFTVETDEIEGVGFFTQTEVMERVSQDYHAFVDCHLTGI